MMVSHHDSPLEKVAIRRSLMMFFGEGETESNTIWKI
jgi:hypothetical protein